MPLIFAVSISDATWPWARPSSSWLANNAFSCSGQSPVHSAHAGQFVEVHHRCHALFGSSALNDASPDSSSCAGMDLGMSRSHEDRNKAGGATGGEGAGSPARPVLTEDRPLAFPDLI
ncbi:hypothetical protein D2T31_20905 [Sinirhodobacter populi]|uniref:Uncharacterized protein n=1 Tax=Paenirhodobacter populi TaxID=2306993 RepID=A0A443K026_9RHOB|nr:hypothetical protein D2T31_20905 [Sinirhodobacter populi]